MNQTISTGNTIRNIYRKKKAKPQEIIFYLSFALLPIIQFIIFYVGVNMQSIAFAFQKYEFGVGYLPAGLDNFKEFFERLFDKTSPFPDYFKNSLLLYVASFCVGFLVLMFSNYVYKKRFASGAIRILLYLPHIASTVTMVAIYKIFVDNGVSWIWEKLTGEYFPGLYANYDTKFGTMMFLALYLTFGNNVLIYTGSMSQINPSIVESAKLDGISNLKEFWHITLPSIFPTWVTFQISAIALIFSDQMLIFNFDSTNAEHEFSTVGYYMYVQVKLAIERNDPQMFPFLSAMGLVLTVIVTTVTYVVKYLLKKFGPSPD